VTFPQRTGPGAVAELTARFAPGVLAEPMPESAAPQSDLGTVSGGVTDRTPATPSVAACDAFFRPAWREDHTTVGTVSLPHAAAPAGPAAESSEPAALGVALAASLGACWGGDWYTPDRKQFPQ
jgi:hypothetical protein